MRTSSTPCIKRKIDAVTTSSFSSSPSFLALGVAEGTTPIAHGYKRSRRELYTFSKGNPFVQHPCEKPFVYGDGTRMPLLKFNPWQLGLPYVLTTELSKFMLYVLSDRESHKAHGISLPEFFVTSDEHHRIEKVVFVAGHGVCPVTLGEQLRRPRSESTVPFLQTCSSIPLRHASIPPTPHVWKYTEVEHLSSLMLWRDRPPVESLSKMIQSVGVMNAFSCHRLVYSCLHDGSVKDEIIFVPDDSLYSKLNDTFNEPANTAQLVDFVEKLVDSTCSNQIEKFAKSKVLLNEVSSNNSKETTICTKFKQGESLYGHCVLKSVADFKVMFIFFNQKLDQILMLVSDEHDGHVVFSNSNFVLTLLKAHEIGINATGSLTKVLQESETNNEHTAHGMGKITSEGIDSCATNWMEASSKRINEMYRSLTAECRLESFHKKIHSCCISLDMLECFDFPVFIFDEKGQRQLVNVVGPTGKDLSFISTHKTDEWKINDEEECVYTNSSNILKSHTLKKEEEEGECTSSDEEDNYAMEGHSEENKDLQKRPLLSEEIKSLGRLKLCAMDCEMCTTNSGALEICRVSLISPEANDDNLIVMDTFVKPDNDIVDYHTEFSGITEEIMRSVSTKRCEVLDAMKHIIGPDTILVGHSLDSDLKALGIVHHRVLDTSILYPHQRGIPYKNSLKMLADEMLGIKVQDDEENGHDSVQDAAVALELCLHYFCNILLNEIDVTISCRPWVNRDQFLIPKIPLIDESTDSYICRRAQRFVQNPHKSRPLHERFLIGYKGESCYKNVDFMDHEIVDVIDRKLPSNFDESNCFTWIDYDLTEMDDENMDNSLKKFDDICNEAYSKYQRQDNALLIVTTQGDLFPLAMKIAKKRRSQWADKVKDGSGDWDGDRDETDLIKAAAHVLSGACFLKHSGD